MSERFAPPQIIFIKASIWSLFVLCVMNKIKKSFILFNIFNKIFHVEVEFLKNGFVEISEEFHS